MDISYCVYDLYENYFAAKTAVTAVDIKKKIHFF